MSFRRKAVSASAEAAFGWILLLLVASPLVGQQPGARVGIWRVRPQAPPGEVKTLLPGDFRANFSGDGRTYRIVFYTLPNRLLNCRDCRSSWFDLIAADGTIAERYGVMWPDRCGFLATAEFQEPTGVHRLVRGEPPMVVSFAVVGADVGILNIFRWNRQSGQLEDVSGDWNEADAVEDVRIENHDGTTDKQIVIVHTRPGSVRRLGTQSVYRWNGKRFELWRTAGPAKK